MRSPHCVASWNGCPCVHHLVGNVRKRARSWIKQTIDRMSNDRAMKRWTAAHSLIEELFVRFSCFCFFYFFSGKHLSKRARMDVVRSLGGETAYRRVSAAKVNLLVLLALLSLFVPWLLLSQQSLWQIYYTTRVSNSTASCCVRSVATACCSRCSCGGQPAVEESPP